MGVCYAVVKIIFNSVLSPRCSVLSCPALMISILVDIVLWNDYSLSFNIDQLGQYFITGGDHPRICLKCTLGGDHLDELLGEVDI